MDETVPELPGGLCTRSLIDNFPNGVIAVLDRELHYVAVGGRGLEGASVAAGDLEGRHFRARLPGELADLLAPLYERALVGEEETVDVTGSNHVWEFRVGPLRGDDGAVVGVMVVARDVTTEHERERRRRDAEERFRLAFDHAPIGMALVGLDGRFLKVNAALCQMTGHAEEDLLTVTFQDLTHPDDLQADLTLVQRCLDGESTSYRLEKRYFDAVGHTFWAMLSATLIRDDDGRPDYFVAQIEDISERKRREEELRRLAERDALTGLWNRRRFDQEVARYEQLAERYGEPSAVLMMDVDRFKVVNDTGGHEAGDRVLEAVARILRTRLRITDLAARYGGDEFAVLLPHTHEDQALSVAEDVLAEVRRLGPVNARAGSVSVSIGVAAVSCQPGSAETTVVRADRAMYEAKAAGGGRVHVADALQAEPQPT